MRTRVTLLFALLALGAIPSVALAQSSTCQSYSNKLCSSVGASSTTTTPSGATAAAVTTTTATSAASTLTTTAASSTGTLPFTGLDLVLLVGGAGALLGAGFMVRRVSRRLD